jgi:hypothetical protein
MRFILNIPSYSHIYLFKLNQGCLPWNKIYILSKTLIILNILSYSHIYLFKLNQGRLPWNKIYISEQYLYFR